MVQHRHPSCFSHLTKWCGEQTKRLLVCSLTCADLASAICCPVPSILEAVSKSASLILIATHLKGLEANWCICSHQKRLQQTSVRFSLCRFTCVTENIRKPSLSHWGKCRGLCENLVLSRNAGKNSSFHGEHDWTVYKCVEEDVLTSCPLWNVHFTARSHGPFHMARFPRHRTRPFPWLLMLLSSLIYLICSSTLNIIESNIEDIEANAYRLQFVETLAVKDATHPSILDDWPRRLCRNSFWHAPVASHQNLKEAGGVMLLQSYCRSTHFETLQTGNHMLLCTQ